MSILKGFINAGVGEDRDIFDRDFAALFEMQPAAFFIDKTVDELLAVAQLDINFFVFLRRIVTGRAFFSHVRNIAASAGKDKNLARGAAIC